MVYTILLRYWDWTSEEDVRPLHLLDVGLSSIRPWPLVLRRRLIIGLPPLAAVFQVRPSR